MQKIISILLLSGQIFTLTVSAQRKGYIVSGNQSSQVYILDQGPRKNSLSCKFQEYKNSDTSEYSPDALDEYGFEDGRVFISKNILINSVNRKYFLERLTSGETDLYLLKSEDGNKFFLEKDSVLLALNRKKGNEEQLFYKSALGILSNDCENIKDAVRLVRYNSRSMTELMNQYYKCDNKPFPFLKYGVNIGYTRTGIHPYNNSKDTLIKKSIFKVNNGAFCGIFLEYPIRVDNFSIHQKIYIKKNAFSCNLKYENIEDDIVINLISVNLPVLIRYTFPKKKISPFIDAGVVYSYNIRNENTIYRSNETNNIISIKVVNESNILAGNQFGYSFGIGLQFRITYRNFLTVEAQYQNIYSLSIPDTYNLCDLQILAGFNF